MLIKHCTRSGLASVLSVLTVASLAGIVPVAGADPIKEHNVQAPAADTNDSHVEEHKLQTPRLQLETDQAMEQSSKALEDAIKQTPKKDPIVPPRQLRPRGERSPEDATGIGAGVLAIAQHNLSVHDRGVEAGGLLAQASGAGG